MKTIKQIQIILIALLTMTAASNCYAYICHDYKAYVGLGMLRSYQWGKSTGTKLIANNNPINIQPSQFQTYIDGGSTVIGFNLKNIGLELGYEGFKNIYYPAFFAPDTSADTTYAKQSGNNVFADLILYHNIYKDLAAKVHLGAGFLTTKYKIYSNVFVTDGPTGQSVQQISIFRGERWGYRAGFGLQWNFARRWSTEFNYMYQNGNQLLDYLQTIRIGINYYAFVF